MARASGEVQADRDAAAGWVAEAAAVASAFPVAVEGSDIQAVAEAAIQEADAAAMAVIIPMTPRAVAAVCDR